LYIKLFSKILALMAREEDECFMAIKHNINNLNQIHLPPDTQKMMAGNCIQLQRNRDIAGK
jgi:hypothetical protein